MPKKLWLDDIRCPPDESWVWVRTANDAITLLKSGSFTEISLDHDLGEPESVVGSGNQVVHWLEWQMAVGNPLWVPENIQVHSANPVGTQNINAAIKSIQKLRSGKS